MARARRKEARDAETALRVSRRIKVNASAEENPVPDPTDAEQENARLREEIAALKAQLQGSGRSWRCCIWRTGVLRRSR